jgi:hypothetical protein
MPGSRCICNGARWVCEAHPDRPWGITGECGCGEPGMPCAFCNPCGGIDDPPDQPRGFQIGRTGAFTPLMRRLDG